MTSSTLFHIILYLSVLFPESQILQEELKSQLLSEALGHEAKGN